MKETVYRYITITPEPPEPKRKTLTYLIISNSMGDTIGRIAWYGSWHQYCFFPDMRSVWNDGCLSDIKDFLKKLREERKKSGK